MRTNPIRRSFTRLLETEWVSLTLKKRALTGRSKGKFRSVLLMLLARVAPSEACRPPAPKGR